MKTIRKIHFHLGVLFAPSILFFAFTGAYQTFRWQENGAAGALTPVLSQMAAIHKNSALETGAGRPRRAPRSDAAPPGRSRENRAGGDRAGGDRAGGDRAGGDRAGGDRAGGDRAGGDRAGGDRAGGDRAGGDRAGGGEAGQNARRPSPLPLKIYVFLMSLGLITSTVTGVVMAFKYGRERRILWSLLAAGTLLPLGLLLV